MKEYRIPIELLDCKVNETESKADEDFIEGNKQNIIDELSKIGIIAQIQSYFVGPTVITYNVINSNCLSSKKVEDFKSELSLTTKTPVRCYFDKKSGFFCVELPRKRREVVGLKKLHEQDGNDLIIVLGKNTKNEYETCNLSVAANMLVVGASGSGKSNFLYAVITSLVFNRSPENLKLLLIATNETEFTAFCGLPHLIAEPAVEAANIQNVLDGIVDETEKRYRLFREAHDSGRNVVNVCEYNESVDDGEKLPQIVVVIDELSEVLRLCGEKSRNAILRLTQKARAAGIYVLASNGSATLASLDRTLLNNFHARIAFKVFKQTDSQIALNGSGAQDLLGKGDFLCVIPGNVYAKRIQSPYASLEVVKNVVEYAKEHFD